METGGELQFKTELPVNRVANPNLGNIENADTTDDGLNIIYGNIQGSNVYDLYNNTIDPIYAQNNDWGVYDSTLIEDHIFHKVDSSALGLS